jgi:N-acyl-D-amino-acid deacylase
MENDILIKNGMVMDGTGTPAVRADVIVNGDRIEDVGSFPDAKASKTIDAEGLAVAPGFVDVHTHLDFFLTSPRHPQVMERRVRQGVTTIVDPDPRTQSLFWTESQEGSEEVNELNNVP